MTQQEIRAVHVLGVDHDSTKTASILSSSTLLARADEVIERRDLAKSLA